MKDEGCHEQVVFSVSSKVGEGRSITTQFSLYEFYTDKINNVLDKVFFAIDRQKAKYEVQDLMERKLSHQRQIRTFEAEMERVIEARKVAVIEYKDAYRRVVDDKTDAIIEIDDDRVGGRELDKVSAPYDLKLSELDAADRKSELEASTAVLNFKSQIARYREEIEIIERQIADRNYQYLGQNGGNECPSPTEK